VRAEEAGGHPEDAAQGAELSRLDHGLDPDVHRAGSLVEDDAEAERLVVVRSEHPPGIRHMHGQRLVREDVEAPRERVDGHLGMTPVGRGDDDGIDLPRGAHRPVIGELPAREILDRVQRAVAERRDFQPVDGRDRLHVLTAHRTHADHTDPDWPHLRLPSRASGDRGPPPPVTVRGAYKAFLAKARTPAVHACWTGTPS
jgi:hypothetical protein